MTRAQDIAAWVRQHVTASACRGLVVALDGDVSSAVVARLCQIAAPGKVIGVMLPCHGDPHDEQDAERFAHQFLLPTVRLDLAPAYDHLVADLETVLPQMPRDQVPQRAPRSDGNAADLPLTHLQARLRMAALHYVANALNYLVAGSVNRSELTTGYFTKYGEDGVDLLPIGRMLEHEVRELARELDIPAAVVDKPPRAATKARHAQEEEDRGFAYADLERYLTSGPDAVSPALAMRIERLVRTSEHKRGLALMPDSENDGVF